ncbi:unnamed protein product [Microthlaspi erraticum]|uniref:F-box domain-containing protein n=1 Tax=Microthlaspi erraticum TaxID=1685480 RepID=A0A6D2K141_9BRAS|nr:unnamed protein product [Microthlaspi erraticum]
MDRVSSLPDSLLCEVLLNLSTAEVVRTSVLSSRWINLWKNVPALDLETYHFPDQDSFVSFVDRFLGFHSGSCLHSFNLKYHYTEGGPHVTRWINTVVNRRKVKHIDLLNNSWDVHMPTTLYTCESLVSLALGGVTLPDPKSVSLPFLKHIYLSRVGFANDSAFEMLISASPVLESVRLSNVSSHNVNCFRVCSKSLLSLSHIGRIIGGGEKELVFAIDAPRLHSLYLLDGVIASFIVKNLGSLVMVDLHVGFGRRFDPNNLPKINMIRDFFNGISTVKHMVISPDTLVVVYDYLRCQPLPLFPNLTSMRVTGYNWQLLLPFLESCPNLKRLVLGSERNPPEKEGVSISYGRPCFLSSLEYVEIQRPWTDPPRKENLVSSEDRLVTYFLENSTLCLDDSTKEGESVILKRPLTTPKSPRLSASRN